jgi:hypothetical protein
MIDEIKAALWLIAIATAMGILLYFSGAFPMTEGIDRFIGIPDSEGR